MLLEKGMVNEFFYCGSIVWIFLKTTVQKITDLCTHEQIGRYFDFVFDDFD